MDTISFSPPPLIPIWQKSPPHPQIPFDSVSFMALLRILLLFSLFASAFSDEPSFNSHLLPRPLILQYPGNVGTRFEEAEDELKLQCTSWRFAAEANNLNPWKAIPQQCAGYVRDYMLGRGYRLDLDTVSDEAGSYARSLELSGDGKDAWIFDIDETLLSNLPYYAEHGYGLEIFNHLEFDKWVEKAIAPAIESSLKLYEKVQELGFKVFLLTGRSENHRNITVENLMKAGFQSWDKLILRGLEERGKQATMYKSEKRNELVKEGDRIHGNSGDQWSDLLGTSMSVRSFKLPNPMYYIP